jgi:hypothetical protein
MTSNRPVPAQSDLALDADAFTTFERTGWERQARPISDEPGWVNPQRSVRSAAQDFRLHRLPPAE